MTEKPFTRTFEEAEKLLRLSSEHPAPCMVGFSYRYTPSFRMAREMIAEGRIGKFLVPWEDGREAIPLTQVFSYTS